MSPTVLFDCAGPSALGPMAEGLARALLPPGTLVLTSAVTNGRDPGAVVAEAAAPHPLAVAVMRDVGIDVADWKPRAAGQVDERGIDRVIDLGGEGAGAVLPALREGGSSGKRERWPISNPARGAEGPEAVDRFRTAREELHSRIADLARALRPEPAIGVVGGTGFYELAGLGGAVEFEVDTPFGPPSSRLLVGRLGERRAVFLARHGRDHSLLPSEINARANLYALKRMGVTQVISVSAVGSLREAIAPGDVVLPRQLIDRTVGRPSTFFGRGAVAHVSLADPICGRLADALAGAAKQVQAGDASPSRRAAGDDPRARGSDFEVHRSGVYLCIEGPQFSTRAESALWRSFGADVVGMTNLPEARLAREAELCYATLALPTDYDCWRTATDEVSVADVMAVLRANVERARRILATALAHLEPAPPCGCRRALDTALLTPPSQLSAGARVRLHEILDRRLHGGPKDP